jgi:putative transposase
MYMKFTRKFARLPDPELYQKNNWYFVTVCVKDMNRLFGEVKNGSMELNILGKIIESSWLNLPTQFNNIVLDYFVIMPNHFHAIIGFNGVPSSNFSLKTSNLGKIIKRFKLETLKNTVATVEDGHSEDGNLPDMTKFQSISEILQSAKWRSSQWRSAIAATGSFWQKGFYDHIIRDENDLNRIREYILLNPQNWEVDEFNC